MNPHRCHLCHRRYKRPEHLRRHFKSHEPGNSFICHLCGQSFSRSDTLKRHASTCTTLPVSRRRACDGCVQSKKACDMTFPCQSCIARDISCTYPDQLLLGLASTTWDEFLTFASRPNLTFLDNFTKFTGLINSFDCVTLELRQAVSTRPSRPLPCDEIVGLIHEVCMIKPRNSIVDISWSAEVEASCKRFFSPAELGRKLELYWSVWHPNVSFLHRPTFSDAKPALIAAMAVLGACVSPLHSDQEDARTWFNAVEEIVYVDDHFCDDSSQITLPKVQSMQAAYIVCLYQNWEGTETSKRRIRRHRFSALVSVARDLGIWNARHTDLDWDKWALKEQLIRTNMWIYLLDTAFVIFNAMPPRIMIREMVMDLACNEAAFQADSPQLCFSLIRPQRLTICEAAESLCEDEVSEIRLHDMADLNALNHFAIASSLHSMIFQHQNTFHSQDQLGPLRNALQNWKLVWERYQTIYATNERHAPVAAEALTAENAWRRIGFMKHADEYWLLASLLLDRICVEEQRPHARSQAPLVQQYDQTSMKQVNDLIAEFQRTTI